MVIFIDHLKKSGNQSTEAGDTVFDMTRKTEGMPWAPAGPGNPWHGGDFSGKNPGKMWEMLGKPWETLEKL
jgi:hypothetical protein